MTKWPSGLRRSTQFCGSIQQGVDVTVPTVLRVDPYIHFPRDEHGLIQSVQQRREGDQMPAIGESDTGLFCLRANLLRQLLSELRRDPNAQGTATAEFNFLPVIPYAVHQGYRVLTPRLMDEQGTRGHQLAG